jgi:two-component system alkaline phosphatase synthesis response regulator PhoP
MVSKFRPLLIFINYTGELNVKKLPEELEVNGFKIFEFEKESIALKFLEKNNVHGVFLTDDSNEKIKQTIIEIRKSENPCAIFCSTTVSSPTLIAELFDVGCDEFFPKSFPVVELIARVKAVLRRSPITRDRKITANINLDTEKFNFHGATINPSSLEIIFSEKEKFKLGKKELGIIYYLSNNPGVIISRNNLIHGVWGAHADTRSRSVDQYITKIRILFEKHAQGSRLPSHLTWNWILV